MISKSLAVLLGVFSLNKVQGRKIPGFIKKLNRALGLPSKSERVWDILFISDLKVNVTENAENINKNAENINNNGENINNNTEIIDNNMADIRKYHPESK